VQHGWKLVAQVSTQANINDNEIVADMAPSVAEADAILARFNTDLDVAGCDLELAVA
jgi:hypothetical protein